MKNGIIAAAMLIASSCVQAPHTDLAIWRSSGATVSQRCDAASALLSPGMTISEVETILGTPDAMMRERGLVIPDGGWVKRWGWRYEFPDGAVCLRFQHSTNHFSTWPYQHAFFFSTRVTRRPESEVSVSIARHSRV